MISTARSRGRRTSETHLPLPTHFSSFLGDAALSRFRISDDNLLGARIHATAHLLGSLRHSLLRCSYLALFRLSSCLHVSYLILIILGPLVVCDHFLLLLLVGLLIGILEQHAVTSFDDTVIRIDRLFHD